MTMRGLTIFVVIAIIVGMVALVAIQTHRVDVEIERRVQVQTERDGAKATTEVQTKRVDTDREVQVMPP